MQTYVMAILGGSPAVITELLWWLVVEEGRDVVGLEVWTTASLAGERSGAQALQAGLDKGLWQDLVAAVGDRAAMLPPAPEPKRIVTLGRALLPSDVSSAERRTTVCAFESDGHYLADIRGEEDADVVVSQLHDRVRQLRGALPEGVALVASLAGGRKTMSAAMQGAFELQARVQDRLVHVLLHPRIEDDPRGRDFRVPTREVAEALGVPIEDQVVVYDVPVPLVRELVLTDDARKGNLAEAFEVEDYAGLLGALRRQASSRAAARARLVDNPRARRPYRLEILEGRRLVAEVEHSEGDAATNAAIARFGATGAELAEIAEVVEAASETGGFADYSDSQSNAGQNLRAAVYRLRRRLRPLVGFPAFLIATPRTGTYRIEAGDAVEGAAALLRSSTDGLVSP